MKSLILAAVALLLLTLGMMYAGAQVEEFSGRVDTAHGVVGCAYKP